jgi:glutathione synthase/RimK-type ligase-like ATP-grasp enzyme
MSKKRIGILFGMEDTFPWALLQTIAERAGADIEAVSVELSAIKDIEGAGYDAILDRISHEVPFYRTFLKCAVFRGARVINNPFWGPADDKFFDNLVADAAGVAVPKTVLLPHKQ